jgi:hypothetical protein
VERALEDILPPVLAEAEAHLDELADQMAGVYANHFTPAELNEMTAFYRSATGQKLVEKTPVVAQQSMAIGQKFGQAMFERSRGRIIEELRKKGHKI